MGHFVRHGDVNLHPVDKVEGKLVKTNGSFVLAEGEALLKKGEVRLDENPYSPEQVLLTAIAKILLAIYYKS